MLLQNSVVVVDARGGTDALQRYESGHVLGSVFFNLETDLSAKHSDAAEGGRHPLPRLEVFSHLLGKAGIDPSSHVVVYDDKSGANSAARFWWMMRSAGHFKIQVVNGGLSALIAAGVPMSEGAPVSRNERPAYPVTNWQLPLADINTVDQARRRDEWLVIDVRENYRYLGEREPIDLVAGHIPGAVNVSYLDSLQPDGKFKSPQALADTYRKVMEGVDNRKVIVHCGSGVTACHSMLAMEYAGLPLPILYVGSWSEWSRNNKPIATGERA